MKFVIFDMLKTVTLKKVLMNIVKFVIFDMLKNVTFKRVLMNIVEIVFFDMLKYTTTTVVSKESSNSGVVFLQFERPQLIKTLCSSIQIVQGNPQTLSKHYKTATKSPKLIHRPSRHQGAVLENPPQRGGQHKENLRPRLLPGKSRKTIGRVSKIKVCIYTCKVALGRGLGTSF